MNPNGAVFYEGPSRFDGAPVVAVITGLARHSKNPKTGDALQTWILRSDVHPGEALGGRDESVCGGCRHRGLEGTRTCYVNVWQAASQVWRAYQRGTYPSGDPSSAAGRVLRMGSYGDPAAIPFDAWAPWIAAAQGVLGYTHAAERRDTDGRLAEVAMTSADSLPQARAAWARGERTFRVMRQHESPTAGEVLCPASREGGYRTTCAACLLCGGAAVKARSVAIYAHGRSAGGFK